MYLKEIWYEVMDWIQVTSDRIQWQSLVNTVIKLRVP